MNILDLLTHNLNHKSRTRKPADAVTYPGDYRGKLLHDTELCTTCGTCVYVCSPSAIKIENEETSLAEWNYMEDRCTFCGFCVQNCPTHALSFTTESPEPITEKVQHYTFHEIEQQPCRICGKPAHSIPEVTLERLYGTPLPAEILEIQGLCEHCRQEFTSKRFLKTIIVKGDRQND
jgi:formate hydrogenlyase subunit 6/NADH:ubiquinone oxidoreductase subunit I